MYVSLLLQRIRVTFPMLLERTPVKLTYFYSQGQSPKPSVADELISHYTQLMTFS
jgi:hypothetical protein